MCVCMCVCACMCIRMCVCVGCGVVWRHIQYYRIIQRSQLQGPALSLTAFSVNCTSWGKMAVTIPLVLMSTKAACRKMYSVNGESAFNCVSGSVCVCVHVKQCRFKWCTQWPTEP